MGMKFDALSPEDRKPCRVYSLWPREVTLHNQSGEYVMPACPPGSQPKWLSVGPAVGHEILGEDGEYIGMVNVSSRRNAMDLIRISPDYEYTDPKTLVKRFIPAQPTSPLTDMGMFVPAGEMPTPAEIEAARGRMNEFLRKKILEGDNAANQGRKAEIPAEAYVGLEAFGEKRSWGSAVGESRVEKCPACSKAVDADAIIHSDCGAVLYRMDDGTLDHKKTREAVYAARGVQTGGQPAVVPPRLPQR